MVRKSGIDKRVTIYVSVSKTLRFRAKIIVEGQPPYEVTVGGKQWQEGKGANYKHLIMPKIAALMIKLQKEYSNVK